MHKVTRHEMPGPNDGRRFDGPVDPGVRWELVSTHIAVANGTPTELVCVWRRASEGPR